MRQKKINYHLTGKIITELQYPQSQMRECETLKEHYLNQLNRVVIAIITVMCQLNANLL